MLQVFLVRHGETEWNAQRRIQGQSNSPLTSLGERQARQAGVRLQRCGVTHIVSSDLGRTRQTAQLIGESCPLPILYDPRLRELNMGVLEGRSMLSLTCEEEAWRHSLLSGDPQGRIPQGESMQEMAQRMRAALDACRQLPEGSRPVIVSHGLALSCLISQLLGLPAWAERRMRLRNGSVSRVDFQKSDWLAEGWIVESCGDISHLES